MITVDLISPGGAFTPAAIGNTQELTTTFSMTSGTATLDCIGASPFVSGDTGKYILIEGPGSDGVSGKWLFGTITYVSATRVTLSVNATKTISSVSCLCFWGSDDGPGFRAFHTWAQAQVDTITATFGSGSKKFMFCTTDPGGNRGGSLGYGLHGVTYQGNGSSQTKLIVPPVNRAFALGATFYIKGGSGAWSDPGSTGYTARLDSVAVGANTVTCKVTARATLFSANTYALITGLDQFGFGQPPDPYLYEWVYITNVNTTTGVITFLTGVSNAYLDTWPVFNTGNPGLEPDQGGPATLYALDPNWDLDVTFQGIELYNPNGQTHTKCRRMTFTDFKVSDGIGLIPTGSDHVEFYNCNLQYSMEIDKLVTYVLFDNTITGQQVFQSPVGTVIYQNGCVIDSFNGTSKIMEVNNSTVTQYLSLGSTAVGRTESFTTTGSTFGGVLTYTGCSDSGDQHPGSGLVGSYTMSNGLITIPISGRAYALRWAIPGCKCYFLGGASGSIPLGPGFRVLSVTGDATNIYVQTDWPFSGNFQSWNGSLQAYPSEYISFAPSTVGSTDEAFGVFAAATALGYNAPGSYYKGTFTGATAGTEFGTNPVVTNPLYGGKLISLKVTIITPYTGAQGTLKWERIFGGGSVQTGTDYATITAYHPVFDLKTGPRTITITPDGNVTGSVGSDSGLAFPSSTAWIQNYFDGMGTGSADIRSEYAGNNAVGPVFTAELIMNPNIALPTAVAPLRLRLRAA